MIVLIVTTSIELVEYSNDRDLKAGRSRQPPSTISPSKTNEQGYARIDVLTAGKARQVEDLRCSYFTVFVVWTQFINAPKYIDLLNLILTSLATDKGDREG